MHENIDMGLDQNDRFCIAYLWLKEGHLLQLNSAFGCFLTNSIASKKGSHQKNYTSKLGKSLTKGGMVRYKVIKLALKGETNC